MSYINTITTDVLNPVVPANTDTICIWPDGCWCYPFELEDFNHRGDDYARVQVDANYDIDQIEVVVQEYTTKSNEAFTSLMLAINPQL